MVDALRLCTDAELGYQRSRTPFTRGAGLVLDESYRLAHLPLVAPTHPKVIPHKEGTHYASGRHPNVLSLVAPIDAEALEQSAAWRALDAELRAAPFAAKIAWDLLPRRRTRLHATLCGQRTPLTPAQREALQAVGPFEAELRGLFSGNINVGRLYLRLYPEQRGGENMVRHLQRALGHRETDLYVVGVWNLIDDLVPAEAAALAGLIERWWQRPLLRFTVDRLWLLSASDDLALQSDVAEIIPLSVPA